MVIITSSQKLGVLELFKGAAPSKKVGLQRLCHELEINGTSSFRKKLYSPHLFNFFSNSDEKIRLWSYKAAALLRADRLVTHLLDAAQNEYDLDARSWAISASNLFDPTWVHQKDRRSDIFFGELQKKIATSFFYKPAQALKLTKSKPFPQDVGTIRWVLLAFGEGHLEIKKEHLEELLNHENWEIRQYCLWAYMKRRSTSLEISDLVTQRAVDADPRVVRWQIRALFKNPNNNIDEIIYYIANITSRAEYTIREGLALGIASLIIFMPDLVNYIVRWHDDEDSMTIRSLLMEYIERFREEIGFKDHYESVLAGRPNIFIQHNEDNSMKIKISGKSKNINANNIKGSPGVVMNKLNLQRLESLKTLLDDNIAHVASDKRDELIKDIEGKISDGVNEDSLIEKISKKLGKLGASLEAIEKIKDGIHKIFEGFPPVLS